VRRGLAYPIAWMLATAVTVSGSWLGIRSVLEAAAPSRPDPLSAADLRRAAPTSAPATSKPPRTSAPPTPSAKPAPSRPPTTRPPPSTTRPAGPPPPTSDPRWQPVPDGIGGTAYRRTLRVQGGEVSAQVGRSGTQILAIRPAPGFFPTETRFDPNTVTVSFTSGGHFSRILVGWRNGPRGEVTESV